MFDSIVLHLAFSFLVCKFISHMNLLFMMHFMCVRCFYFVLFGTPETGFAQLQVCISFTEYWWVVCSCEVPSVSLCLISYHSTCTPLFCILCQHISRLLLSYQTCISLHCIVILESSISLWTSTALGLHSCFYGIGNQSVLPFQYFRIKKNSN